MMGNRVGIFGAAGFLVFVLVKYCKIFTIYAFVRLLHEEVRNGRLVQFKRRDYGNTWEERN